MHISRRNLLGAVLAGGAAGSLTGCGGTFQSLGSSPIYAAPAQSLPVTTVGPDELVPLRFFKNDLLNFLTLLMLGGSASLTAEAGEIARMVQTINARSGDPSTLTSAAADAFFDVFGAQGDALAAAAASAASHRVTRRQRLQRASQYAAAQLFFVLATSRPDREEAVFRVCEQRFEEAASLYDPPAQRFTVSSAFGDIPGYFFRPAADQAVRPTIIISNGSDGQNIDLSYAGLAAGLARGYNVVLFEGPGQMTPLFVRKVPFTANWDEVVGPVYNWVKAQPGVDKVGLIGISFGGMLCARAAANVTGLNAVVLEPAGYSWPLTWDDAEGFKVVREAQNLPPAQKQQVAAELNAASLQALATMSPDVRFNVKKRGEIFVPSVMLEARAGQLPSDYFGLLEAMLPFDYANDFARISIPTMLTVNEGDQFFGRQAEPAFAMLGNVPPNDKILLQLTVAQGAQLHDQPTGPTVAQELIFDWLEGYLR